MAASPRFTIRATDSDLSNIDRIADALRLGGIRYPTRAAAVRHALAKIAAEVSAPKAGGGAE